MFAASEHETLAAAHYICLKICALNQSTLYEVCSFHSCEGVDCDAVTRVLGVTKQKITIHNNIFTV
jgi:hypothetical protein